MNKGEGDKVCLSFRYIDRTNVHGGQTQLSELIVESKKYDLKHRQEGRHSKTKRILVSECNR